jgi:hypothetical protein
MFELNYLSLYRMVSTALRGDCGSVFRDEATWWWPGAFGGFGFVKLGWVGFRYK